MEARMLDNEVAAWLTRAVRKCRNIQWRLSNCTVYCTLQSLFNFPDTGKTVS